MLTVRQSHKDRTSSSGFTIVELLIVIVVVAILAAITVVAYNGVQTRAYQSANQATVRAYLQAFRLIKADTGSLPEGYYNNASCLGPDPQPSPCALAGQTASAASTTSTKSLLQQYGMTSQPGIKGGSYGYLVYTSTFYGEPALLWHVTADQDCIGSTGRFRIDPNWVDGIRYSTRSSTTTTCYLSLKDL